MLPASSLLLLAVLSSLVPCSRGQTSLYSGYAKKKAGLIDDIPTITLSNGEHFPQIGLGVGNLQANRVENMVYEGIKAEHRIRLIDTAYASGNEKQVARGIVSGVRRFRKTENYDDPVQVHVVTKVWYTHLGYNRTKLSVKQSLDNLSDAIKDPNVDLRVHVLIHWPRCFDGIEWMNCEGEEAALPEAVKKAGPPPHLDKKNAWKQSWKALEDMYLSADYPAIASIGVSNFGNEDMKELVAMAREKPHMTQINVWSLLFDMHLVDTCNRHNIHIQLFNIMNGIISNVFSAPFAHHHLLRVANWLTKRAPEGNRAVTASQTVLKWLLQFGMSIVVRTSDLDRLTQNSAVVLAAIPNMTDEEIGYIAKASAALIGGEDVPDDVYVKVTFHAANQDMFLYSVAGQDDYQQVAFVPKGEVYHEQSHPHQRFRMYLATDPDVYHDYTVEGKYGDHKEVRVDL